MTRKQSRRRVLARHLKGALPLMKQLLLTDDALLIYPQSDGSWCVSMGACWGKTSHSKTLVDALRKVLKLIREQNKKS